MTTRPQHPRYTKGYTEVGEQLEQLFETKNKIDATIVNAREELAAGKAQEDLIRHSDNQRRDANGKG
jgi:hypothetical protein